MPSTELAAVAHPWEQERLRAERAPRRRQRRSRGGRLTVRALCQGRFGGLAGGSSFLVALNGEPTFHQAQLPVT